jgi:hypothetical protein
MEMYQSKRVYPINTIAATDQIKKRKKVKKTRKKVTKIELKEEYLD